MRRAYKIGAVAVWAWIITFGLIVGYWWLGLDPGACDGDECVLEYAAVMTGALVTASLVGAACGFVTYALTGGEKGSP